MDQRNVDENVVAAELQLPLLTGKSKHIHCIGVGGIGVSGLAELLLAKGYRVSGSDLQSNAQTQRLASLGVRVTAQHHADNINGADCVIYSNAIATTNPEYVAATLQQLPLLPRGLALAALMGSQQAITVTGTHGKTTTTAIMAHVFTQLGLDPSYAIGGVLNGHQSPVRVGNGCHRYFIAEVDESDASFLYTRPCYAIVTNIDADHLEAYQGSFQRLQQRFVDYLNRLPPQGAAFICIDDPVLSALLPQLTCRVITYGFAAGAQLQVCRYQQQGLYSHVEVSIANKENITMTLNFPGKHNIQNALASLALIDELNISVGDYCRALTTFPGVGRRFHCHGELILSDGAATVIEDYGHHPREISVTLDAVKAAWPDKRIVLVFQPHRYTRTRDLYQDFVTVLAKADQLFLLDVYSASEEPIENISSVTLCEAIFAKTQHYPHHVKALSTLPATLQQYLKNDDVLIVQGAGSIGAAVGDIFAHFASTE